MPKRGANEHSHHAVVIVKRTAGCTENQANWLWANRQHLYFFSKAHGNSECTITRARCYSFNSPQ